MSYRLINSNAIAIKYPEVNDMPCVFANLPDGLNGQFIDAQTELPTGKWKIHKDGSGTCSICGITQIAIWDMDGWQNFCGHCGARMEGTDG